MKQVSPLAFDRLLRQRLGTAQRIAIVSIGDENSAVDRFGMEAAREIERQHLSGVRVFFAGTVPESMTGPLREFHPDHILLVDAADMGNPPGTVAIIDPERIPAGHFSTHALPLSAVMEFIEKDTGANVTLVGIQPDLSRDELGPDGRDLLHRNLVELVGVLRERCGGWGGVVDRFFICDL
ncbi:MAG: hydrogenase 3 maturation endopeptidase HyCI [Methanoregula sp.]|nr:hydrogenase 3 maturation endopeptidase HyCI [Methanoregula sp.]